MKLIPLSEGELRFDETTEVGFPTHGEDGDWSAYVEGDGAVSGARLTGWLRWTNHPRRRADGTWLPSFEGVIRTDDEAEILFAFGGYNTGVTDPFEYDIGVRWRPSPWRVRAYECVNEIATEQQG
jgi:hypothetical protein